MKNIKIFLEWDTGGEVGTERDGLEDVTPRFKEMCHNFLPNKTVYELIYLIPTDFGRHRVMIAIVAPSVVTEEFGKYCFNEGRGFYTKGCVKVEK